MSFYNCLQVSSGFYLQERKRRELYIWWNSKRSYGRFLGSTAVFILVTTAFIKYLERGSEEPTESIGETIYLQLEYVLTIIASQGKIIK